MSATSEDLIVDTKKSRGMKEFNNRFTIWHNRNLASIPECEFHEDVTIVFVFIVLALSTSRSFLVVRSAQVKVFAGGPAIFTEVYLGFKQHFQENKGKVSQITPDLLFIKHSAIRHYIFCSESSDN